MIRNQQTIRLIISGLVFLGITFVQIIFADTTTTDPFSQSIARLSEILNSDNYPEYEPKDNSNADKMSKAVPQGTSQVTSDSSSRSYTVTAVAKTQNSSNKKSTNHYQNLSAGNRKIAGALHSAQYLDAVENYPKFNATRKNWTLEKIANTNQKTKSWGQIFKLMKAENLIEEENLGQVMRNHSDMIKANKKPNNDNKVTPAKKKEAIVITNASGEYLVINRTDSKGPDNL